MFIDSILVCQCLGSSRDQWDDIFKANAKLARIGDVEEKKGLEFLRKSLATLERHTWKSWGI